MSETVLVTYASKNGSTKEIAAALADELRSLGVAVELTEVGDVGDLGRYGTIVLGSAVYMARWRPEARRFLKRRQKELRGHDVWLFSSGPIGEQRPDAERWTTPKLVTQLGPRIGVREHVVFGGRVPVDPTNFVERAMARDTPEHLRDLRDWHEIRRWAHRIALATRPDRAAA